MTPEELTAAAERALERIEEDVLADLAAAYERVLRSMGRDMARRFRSKAVVAAILPPNEDEVVDRKKLTKAVERRVKPHQDAAVSGVEAEMARTGVDFTIGGLFSDTLIERAGERAVFAADKELRETFREVIAASVDEGWSVPQTSQAIIEQVQGMAGFRAEALARTDLIGIANGRSLGIAQEVFSDREGGEITKVWLTAGDDRVRETHADADGQEVPLAEPFDVGGAALMYPGDPDGPDEEVFNCRCTVTYSDGRPDEGIAASAQPVERVRSHATTIRRQEMTEVLTAAPTGDGDIAELSPIDWNATLCVEGAPTEDGRLLERGSLTWRDLPLTLMGLTSTGFGHDGAEAAGRIDQIMRAGDDINADGQFTTDFGINKLSPMVDDRTVRGVSIDLAVQEWEIRNRETGEVLDGEEEIIAWLEGTPTLFVVLDGVILGATVCPMPAVADAEIAVAAGGSVVVASSVTPNGVRMTIWTPFDRRPLTASGGMPSFTETAVKAPPRDWFNTTEFPGPTPLTFAWDEEVGLTRVFGHLADWQTCHTGIQGVCIRAPHSPSGYAYFHVGEVETAEGDFVNYGKIMLGTKHASLQASRAQATQHYDDHGKVGVRCRANDGEHGIWLSGYVPDFVTAAQMDELRGNPPSGDWRAVERQLELVAACAVPIPGFPIPRVETSIVASAGEMTIASMILNSGVIVPGGEVRTAMIAAGCGCEEELALLDEGIEDLAALAD